MKSRTSWFSADKLERDTLWYSILQASKYAKGKLLDVGCGEKPYFDIFRKKVDSYVGLDISEADVIGSALDLPFKDNTFNTVLSTQVIEHVDKPEIMIKEIHRVLKKDGYLILTAPLFWCLHEEPEDYYRFTKYSLEKLIKREKFDLIYIRDRGNWLITLGQMISLFLESSFNRMALRYPKRAAQMLIQYIFYLLSKIEKLNNKNQAPLGYIVVAKKI